MFRYFLNSANYDQFGKNSSNFLSSDFMSQFHNVYENQQFIDFIKEIYILNIGTLVVVVQIGNVILNASEIKICFITLTIYTTHMR
jgi:hypothetical protein